MSGLTESVRGADCFVHPEPFAPINDNIMEQLITIDALKRASARRITAVIPFFGYSRQDKKVLPREPITARLVADLFMEAGADRLVSVDLHTGQLQGFIIQAVRLTSPPCPSSPTTCADSSRRPDGRSSHPMPAV